MSALKWLALMVFLLAASAGAGFVAARWLLRSPPPPVPDELGAPPPAGPSELERRPVELPDAAPAAQVPSADPWAATNREAIAALERGELEHAIELFEACHRADPDQQVFARNLAEALTRRALRDHNDLHPCPDCVPMLERAVSLAPDREETGAAARALEARAADRAGLLARQLAALRPGLRRLPSRDARLEPLAAQARGHLHRAARALRARPVEIGGPRIAVVLYERESFDKVTGLGHWAGGAFDGTVRVPVEDVDDEQGRLDRILRHELTHAFVRAVGGTGVPGWLNEGLAQLREPGRASSVAGARKALAGHTLFPLEACGLARELERSRSDRARLRRVAGLLRRRRSAVRRGAAVPHGRGLRVGDGARGDLPAPHARAARHRAVGPAGRALICEPRAPALRAQGLGERPIRCCRRDIDDAGARAARRPPLRPGCGRGPREAPPNQPTVSGARSVGFPPTCQADAGGKGRGGGKPPRRTHDRGITGEFGGRGSGNAARRPVGQEEQQRFQGPHTQQHRQADGDEGRHGFSLVQGQVAAEPPSPSAGDRGGWPCFVVKLIFSSCAAHPRDCGSLA